MKGKKQVVAAKQAKVIPIQWDATFFFERAVRSLDRYHYDKALKYFRRAVEYEPDNPVNHCNMAGILSEMGNYEQSNEILKMILEELDPDMTECYFYMANNYANLELYEAAEDALILYLERDTEGQFADEAEEMMELLRIELERPIRQPRPQLRTGSSLHDEARLLLEAGRFKEAVRMLERLVDEQDDFIAARNNLALAYYYLGQFERCYATVCAVLEREPGNLHALCNLAVFYQHAGDEAQLGKLLALLKKTVPYQPEQAFKLATTLGVLGEHQEAYGHFQRLLRHSAFNQDPSLCHYSAIAAANLGRFEEAGRHWEQAARLDPGSEIPRFYLAQLPLMRTGEEPSPTSYHYHLPFEEQFRLWERSATGSLPDQFKRDPLIRSSFFWALRHGDKQTKLQVIQALGMIGDVEVKEALQAFLLEKDEEDDLKRIALFVLRTIGMVAPVRALLEGRVVTIDSERMTTSLPVWDAKWQAVLEAAFKRMGRGFDMIQQYDLLTLWVDFLSRTYPEVPKIGKPEGWAAALEYWTAKMHRRTTSYHEVASSYGISIATVSKLAKRIDETCGIKAKIRATQPVFPERPAGAGPEGPVQLED